MGGVLLCSLKINEGLPNKRLQPTSGQSER
jgi:hypothetical protein